MPRNLPTRTSYLITSGETNRATTPASEEFAEILTLVRLAVAARISLIQLREKSLTPRALYELTSRAASITRNSETRLLVNDRADIAGAAGADGCHLTTRSLEAGIVRRAFGQGFLIGVSAHSLEEALAARDGCADFATFGPVFETTSKRIYGPPVGLEKLGEAARTLAPFPLIALGGITRASVRQVLRSGASGIGAIGLFSDTERLPEIVREINES